MKITIDLDEYEGIELTPDDYDMLDANITHITMKASVSHKFQSKGCEVSLDRPPDMELKKCFKYLHRQVDYQRQVAHLQLLKEEKLLSS